MPDIRDLLVIIILTLNLALGVLLIKVKKKKTLIFYAVFILLNLVCGKSDCFGPHWQKKKITVALLRTEFLFKLTFSNREL